MIRFKKLLNKTAEDTMLIC